MGRNGNGNGSHQRDLTGIIELYLTSCRIEGKSEETVRSYRESLGVFTSVIEEERLPEDPASFTAAHVYQFLGCVADTGVSAMTQWRRQRETRAFWICQNSGLKRRLDRDPGLATPALRFRAGRFPALQHATMGLAP
jgi:site-specific recombinase XerD